jgi:hypothetical protein
MCSDRNKANYAIIFRLEYHTVFFGDAYTPFSFKFPRELMET